MNALLRQLESDKEDFSELEANKLWLLACIAGLRVMCGIFRQGPVRVGFRFSSSALATHEQLSVAIA